MPSRVVVVGSANADLVCGVERRPSAGETVLGGDLVTLPGGKGANQAVAAALLGADVVLVACLGRDAHGDLLASSLTAAGVDVSAVRRVDSPTGVAIILVDAEGDNSIVVSSGANRDLGVDDATGAVVAGAGVLLLQREVDPEVSLAAARATAGRVVLNLAPSGPMPDALLARTDVLVVNEHEAADLLGGDRVDGVDAAAAAGRRLLGLGPSAAVVTLGGHGAVVVDAGGTTHVDAPAVTPVDTTGAGDAFTGALAHRLAAGDDLVAAARVAVRVGAIAVTRPGAQPSYPRAAELT